MNVRPCSRSRPSSSSAAAVYFRFHAVLRRKQEDDEEEEEEEEGRRGQTDRAEEGIWRRRGEEIQNRRLHPRRWRWQRADWLWRSALQFLPARGWPALPCLALPRHVMSLTSIIVSNAAYYPLGGGGGGGGAATQGTGARASVGHAHPFLFWRPVAARGWVAPPHVEEEYSVITCCQF